VVAIVSIRISEIGLSGTSLAISGSSYLNYQGAPLAPISVAPSPAEKGEQNYRTAHNWETKQISIHFLSICISIDICTSTTQPIYIALSSNFAQLQREY
jgi:hypothetical protein